MKLHEPKNGNEPSVLVKTRRKFVLREFRGVQDPILSEETTQGHHQTFDDWAEVDPRKDAVAGLIEHPGQWHLLEAETALNALNCPHQVRGTSGDGNASALENTAGIKRDRDSISPVSSEAGRPLRLCTSLSLSKNGQTWTGSVLRTRIRQRSIVLHSLILLCRRGRRWRNVGIWPEKITLELSDLQNQNSWEGQWKFDLTGYHGVSLESNIMLRKRGIYL